METTIMENQMEKKMENEMEAGRTYRRQSVCALVLCSQLLAKVDGHEPVLGGAGDLVSTSTVEIAWVVLWLFGVNLLTRSP